MSDRYLLERAAKAAQIEISFGGYPHKSMWRKDEYEPDCPCINNDPRQVWNPLLDDGDALRLAAKIGIDLMFYSHYKSGKEDGLVASATDHNLISDSSMDEPHNGDIYAATRRAIVRAAAALAPPPNIRGNE